MFSQGIWPSHEQIWSSHKRIWSSHERIWPSHKRILVSRNQILQPITLSEVELFEYDYSSKFGGFLISKNKNTKTPLIVAARSITIK